LKKSGVELLLGSVIIVIGLVLYFLLMQLYWAAIYPPPLGRQILDALPPLIWVVGGSLIADGLWRIVASKKTAHLRFTQSLVLGEVLTICSLIYGEEVNWPDFYHVNYGLPLSWITRTLSTIAGPVDVFKVNFSTLVIDIIFWFVIALLASWSFNKIKKR